MRYDSDIVFVASEIFPFSKSGGLADVMGILPLTLHRMGYKVCVVTPLYGRLATARYQLRLILEDCPVGYPWPSVTADIYVTSFEGMPVYFIDRGEYFDRRNFYCTHKGDYFDNCERFIFFCRAALAWIRRLEKAPRIINANDWHAALVPAFLHFQRINDAFWVNTSSVMTIHNLAFQGQYSSRLFYESGLPHHAWHMDGAEYYGSFNMLKTGIAYADGVSTVSPTYAEEILTPGFGAGLEGILNKRSDRLWGILNGADYEIWGPEKDSFLACRYDCNNIKGKRECKQNLIDLLCLDKELINRPILGFVGRLRRQKGIDLVLDIIPDLVKRNVAVVVLGEGNREFEIRLQDMMERYQGRVYGFVGYTEELSHMILAGTDIFLMPSRYEPCGLTQMYSLRYGTVPVATSVGGLRDTIIPYPVKNATGFVFEDFHAKSLLAAVDQALEVWGQPVRWKLMQTLGMQADFSWDKSCENYIRMYKFFNGTIAPETVILPEQRNQKETNSTYMENAV